MKIASVVGEEKRCCLTAVDHQMRRQTGKWFSEFFDEFFCIFKQRVLWQNVHTSGAQLNKLSVKALSDNVALPIVKNILICPKA